MGRKVGGRIWGVWFGNRFIWGRLRGGCLAWWTGHWQAVLGMSGGYKVGLEWAERWGGWHAGGNWLGEGGFLEGCTGLGMAVVAFCGVHLG